jgi:hypothetical protein
MGSQPVSTLVPHTAWPEGKRPRTGQEQVPGKLGLFVPNLKDLHFFNVTYKAVCILQNKVMSRVRRMFSVI